MQGGLFDEEPQPAQPPPVATGAAEERFTWSEAWRRECEARHVLTMGRLQQDDYLRRVAARRSAAAAEQLRQDVEAAR